MQKSIPKARNRIITMRDIADHAKVSQTTVSLVLNNRQSKLISEATRDRVLSMATELGYRPNQFARALATGRTNIIGLWVRSLHSSYYTQLIHDLDQLVSNSSYNSIICRNTTTSDLSSVMQAFPIMLVDGIIAIDILETVDYYVSSSSSAVPIVHIGSAATDSVDCVLIDQIGGTREALEQLYAMGRRNIAFLIDAPSLNHINEPRLLGYRTFVETHKLQTNFMVSPGQLRAEAMNTVTQQITHGNVPDALFCYNDDMAMGANRAVHALGLRVPEEIAIIGYDNITEAQFMEPPLSSVEFPREALCATAWNLLKHRIAQPSAPRQHITLPTKYVQRESG